MQCGNYHVQYFPSNKHNMKIKYFLVLKLTVAVHKYILSSIPSSPLSSSPPSPCRAVGVQIQVIVVVIIVVVVVIVVVIVVVTYCRKDRH